MSIFEEYEAFKGVYFVGIISYYSIKVYFVVLIRTTSPSILLPRILRRLGFLMMCFVSDI